jgi:hypothetical protein
VYSRHSAQVNEIHAALACLLSPVFMMSRPGDLLARSTVRRILSAMVDLRSGGAVDRHDRSGGR